MSPQETLASQLVSDQQAREAGALAVQALQESESARPYGEGALGNTWYLPSEHLEWRQPTERELEHTAASALQLREKQLRIDARNPSAGFSEGDVARAIITMRTIDKQHLAIGGFGEAVSSLRRYVHDLERDKIKLDDVESDEVVYKRMRDTVRQIEDDRFRIGEEHNATYHEEAREVERLWQHNQNGSPAVSSEDTGSFEVIDIASQEDDVKNSFNRKRTALVEQAKKQGLDEEVVAQFLQAEALATPRPELSEKDRVVLAAAVQHSLRDIFEKALGNQKPDDGADIKLDPSQFTADQMAEIERLHETMQWIQDPTEEIRPYPLFVAYHTASPKAASEGPPVEAGQVAQTAIPGELDNSNTTTGAKFRRIVRQLVSPGVEVGASSAERRQPAGRRRKAKS